MDFKYDSLMWGFVFFYMNFLFYLQVLRGLAYLREKHQIMHRGNWTLWFHSENLCYIFSHCNPRNSHSRNWLEAFRHNWLWQPGRTLAVRLFISLLYIKSWLYNRGYKKTVALVQEGVWNIKLCLVLVARGRFPCLTSFFKPSLY